MEMGVTGGCDGSTDGATDGGIEVGDGKGGVSDSDGVGVIEILVVVEMMKVVGTRAEGVCDEDSDGVGVLEGAGVLRDRDDDGVVAIGARVAWLKDELGALVCSAFPVPPPPPRIGPRPRVSPSLGRIPAMMFGLIRITLSLNQRMV